MKEFLTDNIIAGTVPPLAEVEDFTQQYPWCALGHKMLFRALCIQGGESYRSYSPKAAVYLPLRADLFFLACTPVAEPMVPIISVVDKPAERIIIIGGDYFARTNLSPSELTEDNPIDRFIKSSPKLIPAGTIDEHEEKAPEIDVDGDDFMTETLAKIYADQALYSLAIEAYGKLILLYPKKSAYFASLIHEIKLKINR